MLAPSSSSTASTLLPASDVLAVYIGSAGIASLAVERLQKYDPNFTEIELYKVLTAPGTLDQLQQAARNQVVLRTFELANQALGMLAVKMASLDPGETSRTANQLIDRLETLTNTNKTEFNINNFVWETLIPDDATQAIKYLQAKKQAQLQAGITPVDTTDLPQVIEHIATNYPMPDDEPNVPT